MTPVASGDLLERPVVRHLADGGGERPPGPPVPPDALQPGPPPSGDENWALRCAICNEDWPLVPRLFGVATPERFMARVQETRDDPEGARLQCPQCLGSVHVADNLNPMPVQRAWSLKNHADFERFYERRGERSPLSEAELERYGD